MQALLQSFKSLWRFIKSLWHFIWSLLLKNKVFLFYIIVMFIGFSTVIFFGLFTPIRLVPFNSESFATIEALRTKETNSVTSSLRVSTATPTFVPSDIAIQPPITSVTAIPTPFPLVGKQVFESDWPPTMTLGQSDSIRVTLIYTTGTVLEAIAEDASRKALLSTPMAVGSTPGTLMQEAFGPEYIASVKAELVGSAFDIKAIDNNTYQLYNQSSITWEWNVTPKLPNAQVLNADVSVIWTPRNKELPSYKTQAWRQRIEVFVDSPVITQGPPIEILPLLLGAVSFIAGSLITFLAPRVWTYITKRLTQPPSQPPTRPQPKPKPNPNTSAQRRRKP